ncbi:sulfatase-like hydrolase/transferase [Phocaeicola barnesiae]|uniref:LTA synthase family protein n=1 Tax=Phocaeicola barnesiae TaxID=376804 RepID=UPI0025A31C99|nr:alkaline phosphatase family protein [Phocaeicola barnesiae]MDM8241824.1 sulfatase-like hydrolase/transferase [Phocaeicola barnesiae]
MMVKRTLFSNVGSLAWNLLLVYVCYFICRLTFLLTNWAIFGDQFEWGYMFRLFAAGTIFDTTAILYSNALFIVLFLFPFHWKERSAFYRVVRWVFVAVNTFFLISNLVDCVYFRFSGRRTTMSVFQEFSHEAGGNMTSIFLKEFAVNWYLVVLAVALGILLYKLFRSPRPLPLHGPKWSYYVVQTVSLLVMAPFVVFGMRGGMTAATRPITISNANQYADRPVDACLVLNTPFSLFRTLGKKAFIVPQYLSEEEAVRVYSPLHTPADSIQFRPMNVVVLIVESFSKEFVGSFNTHLDNGTYKGYTPFLDSLLTKGLTFQYSYSNGRKSIDGMPSVLSSIPSFVEPFFLTPASLNNVSSLARELKHKGYYSAFFHGAMNGSMGFQAFANSVGFDSYWGRTEYNEDPKYHGDDDFDGTWAIWDEEFLQFFCDRMTEFKQPFVTSVFTATSHNPYALPERYKNVFPKGTHPIHECIGYTDNALHHFFATASKQPWYNNTLFVITADHASMNEHPEYVTDLGAFTVPILFYAPGMPELQGKDTETVVEQIDIMPTVLGILGYDRPYIGFGQDILHTPKEDKFAVNYISGSGIYQLVKGDYLIQFDGEQVIHAYRFRTDVLMKDDVKDSMPQEVRKEMETQLKSIIQQYMQRMNNNELVYRE